MRRRCCTPQLSVLITVYSLLPVGRQQLVVGGLVWPALRAMRLAWGCILQSIACVLQTALEASRIFTGSSPPSLEMKGSKERDEEIWVRAGFTAGRLAI